MAIIDTFLRKEVEKIHTPSVAYIHFNKDNIIHQFKSGMADIKNRIKVDDKTTYHAFSVTKTFTALAILQLAEQHKIAIDHPVIQYLPDFPYAPGITIRQLLTHSAGIPNPIPLNWIHLTSEHSLFDRNAFFNEVMRKHNKIKSKPDERYAYSNLGYILLGQLIEKVSGATYEQYISTNIIKKLGIGSNELGFVIDDYRKHAVGYHKRWSLSNIVLGFFIDKREYMGKSVGKWKPFKNFYVNGTSYGGLIGTPRAFMKYIQALLQQDSNLLAAEYKQLLFTENFLQSHKGTGMCLSWFTGQLNGQTYFTHAGGGGGYYCEIRIYPEAGLGSVIMFNRTGMRDERYLDKVDRYVIK